MNDCHTCTYFEEGDDPKRGLCRFSSVPLPVPATATCPGHLLPGEAIPEYVPFPEEEGSHPSDLRIIREFISDVEWRFAKTMPDAPHWYTVLRWNPDKSKGFFLLAAAIFEIGEEGIWTDPSGTTHQRKYFHLDGFKYWSMDASIEKTDLINRALEEVTQ